MHKGVITIADFNNPLINKLSCCVINHNILKRGGYWEIYDKDKNIAGHFVEVYGSKWLVKFMEWLTDYRGEGAIKHPLKD